MDSSLSSGLVQRDCEEGVVPALTLVGESQNACADGGFHDIIAMKLVACLIGHLGDRIKLVRRKCVFYEVEYSKGPAIFPR